MKKIVLIPAYEPDEKLIDLVKKLEKNKYIIIVVNDGSSKKYDSIFEIVKKYAKVISYKNNMGKGYALKKGIAFIDKNYNDYIIVTMDADGQHTVEDANRLYEYNKNNLDTLVLGKRLRDKNVPKRSRFGNFVTCLIYKIITKRSIYDTQTGLRSFSNNLTSYMLELDGDRYEFEMNMLLNLSKYNILVKEMEIKTIYFNNNSNSHFSTVKDSYLVYKQIFKYSISSILSFITDYSLYIIFSFFFNITLSNIFSRIISGTLNYQINKKIVFKSNRNFTSAFEYFFLSLVILLLNTLVLNVFVFFGINKYVSKVITEFILFLLSYIVQKKVIFNKSV